MSFSSLVIYWLLLVSMIKVSQEGEQAGAGLMSRVTVLIDQCSREVAPFCSTNPS